MRKRIIGTAQSGARAQEPWLDLENAAEIEVTSEESSHPIESALTAGSGWRAAEPGRQIVRVIFDRPQSIRRIHLLFEERDQPRTQEFLLRWSGDRQSYSDIVRQQYNFSPPATVEEREDYKVVLDGLTVLELSIVPDIGGGSARASLAELRVA